MKLYQIREFENDVRKRGSHASVSKKTDKQEFIKRKFKEEAK